MSRLALELHEYQVPYLYHVRVALIHQVAAGDAAGSLFLGGTDIDVDFGARAAGAGLAHLPEVVVLVAEEDAVGREILHPSLAGLLVEGGAILGATLENGGVEEFGIDPVNLGKQFPGPVNGFGLEVIAEAPVAEHLEHRMVIGIVSYFLEVIVFAAHAEALLTVGGTAHLRHRIPQEDVLELVHTSVGEHQGRVIFYHHRSGRDDGMPFGFEVVKKFLTYFLGCHHYKKQYLKYNPAKILLFF